MSYNRSIPQPTDLISNSQAQLLGNFQAIDSGTTGTGAGFSRNHITMTDATNGGLHNRVDFYQNVSDPAISGFASSVYTKAGTTGNSELFYKSSASVVTQLTGVATSAGTSGTVQLPGGIILKWGNVGVSDNGSVSFPNGSFPNNCFIVVPSPQNNSSPPSVPDVAAFSITTGGFSVRVSVNGSAGSTTINYFAIGN